MRQAHRGVGIWGHASKLTLNPKVGDHHGVDGTGKPSALKFVFALHEVLTGKIVSTEV